MTTLAENPTCVSEPVAEQTNPVHVSPCGCRFRFYQWGGWAQERACSDHPMEPEPKDRPTPEERRMYAEWGSRSARLP